MKQGAFSHQIAIGWNKLPLILRSVLSGFSVSAAGIAIWSVFLTRISAPWSIPPMIIFLWAYLKNFSGFWGLKKGGADRKFNFRSIKLLPMVWKRGLIAAILFIIIVQASFVITFRVIDFHSD